MKKFFLAAITALTSCNFYDNKNVGNTEVINHTAKIVSIRHNIETKTETPDIQTKILGKWYRDEDRSSYWEFKNDGKVYFYEDGVLNTKSTYSISHNCAQNSDPKFEFLKIIDEDGSEYCSEINGINENNSGILSLTSMQNLEVVLFVNDINITIPN